MKTAIATVVLVLAGCASSTGIVPMGEGTYLIAREDNSPTASLGAIKAAVLKDAATFCGAKGQDFAVVHTNDTPRSLGQFPQTSLQFRCVSKTPA